MKSKGLEVLDIRGIVMRFYKLAFMYSAFNQGYSITAPVKWFGAIFGIAEVTAGAPTSIILLGALGYLLLCFAIGIPAFRYGWVDAMNEVNNRYNPLAKELRNSKIFKGRKQ